MVKRKLLALFFFVLIAGCSGVESRPEARANPVDLTASAWHAARGMLTVVTRSGAPIAAIDAAEIVRVEDWLTILRGEIQPMSLANQGSRWIVNSTSASPVVGIITIGGHVVNASGGIPPQNAFVDLTIFENGTILSHIKIPLDQSGIFRFDLIPWNPGYAYQVSTTFNELTFSSGLINGNVLQPGTIIDVPLVVYDSSTNTDFLRALRMKVIYDFSTPGRVVVSENILISNPTSMVIVPAGDNVPVLEFVLPNGAANVVFPDGNPGNRYHLTTNGFGDWQPVMPGDGHQVMVQYTVPFTSTWHCNLNIPIPLDSLMVVVKASGIETTSTGLELNLVQSDPETALTVYGATELQSSGNYALTFATRDHIQRIWFGIAFFVLTLGFALLWAIHIRRQRESDPSHPIAETTENKDTILDAIIALDDRFKHGDISSEVYTRTRSEMVEKLEVIKNQNKG